MFICGKLKISLFWIIENNVINGCLNFKDVDCYDFKFNECVFEIKECLLDILCI